MDRCRSAADHSAADRDAHYERAFHLLTSRQVADAAPFATVAITGGVLTSEALALFQK